MKLTQVPKFEKLNSISINVFGYEDEVFPLYISKNRFEKHVDLLLISDDEKSHFCLIRNMSRLLSGLTKDPHAKFYCNFCLHRFKKEKTLLEHLPYCEEHGPQKIRMPEGDEAVLKFKNPHFQLRLPFVVYADFESVLVKASTCSNNPTVSSSEVVSHHEPCGFCYVIVGPEGTLIKSPVVYRGPDAAVHFMRCLLQEEEEILQILKTAQPICMTEDDEKDFQAAIYCHICRQHLGNDRVRNHDHLKSGRNYLGAAHNACNLNFRLTKKIAVLIQNTKNYDSHIIMEAVGKIKDRKIECIASNMEKYITFSVGHLHFLDTFQFLNSSLQSLVSNLSDDQFHITRDCMGGEKLHLLTRKGVYPYEYVDSFQKFSETSLPPKEAFFSSLTDEHISSEDYSHAEKVWRAFQIKDLGEYHDLYLKTDVLLLADVFENFRSICFENYDLDPCHMYTAPGLAWQACLKMTGIEMELLTDPTMYMFLEKGIRGGISMISTRFAEANNKYMSTYDSQQASKYIMYLDANNLYGWAMSQPLPVRDFTWGNPEDFDVEKILNISDDCEIGFVFEVDLEYPDHLHDLHNEYPLAPEKFEITSSILSPYLEKTQHFKTSKLVPNLYDKQHYVIHYRNLKQYLQLGLKLTKVHKVLRFRQSAWLKPYIDLNTEKRKHARNEFEKNFFKLMNNSVFGKTMENLRKRTKIDLVTTEKKAKKLVASPAFHAFKIFNEDLVGVERKKTCLLLNRPVYAGFSILDVSKTLMYSFHYDHVKERYGENAALLFTDTDSLCYLIKTDDVYSDMSENIEKYDTSDYEATHFLHSLANKKRIGKMKDEMNGVPIIEFVGLRPKMYSMKSEMQEKKTAKGVAKCIIKNKLKHQNYKTCLLEKQTTRETMYRIMSEKHQIYTSKQRKVALTPYDDKRFILPDGIHTLAYGHKNIKSRLMNL